MKRKHIELPKKKDFFGSHNRQDIPFVSVQHHVLLGAALVLLSPFGHVIFLLQTVPNTIEADRFQINYKSRYYPNINYTIRDKIYIFPKYS